MIRQIYNERQRIWYWFVKKHSIYFDSGNRTLTKVTTWQIISAELPPFLLPSSPSCCASWQSACSSRTWGPPAEKTKSQVRTRSPLLKKHLVFLFLYEHERCKIKADKIFGLWLPLFLYPLQQNGLTGWWLRIDPLLSQTQIINSHQAKTFQKPTSVCMRWWKIGFIQISGQPSNRRKMMDASDLRDLSQLWEFLLQCEGYYQSDWVVQWVWAPGCGVVFWGGTDRISPCVYTTC